MPGIVVERAHDKLIADVQRLDEHIGITLLTAQPLRNEPQRGDRQIEPASMGHDRAERITPGGAAGLGHHRQFDIAVREVQPAAAGDQGNMVCLRAQQRGPAGTEIAKGGRPGKPPAGCR